ncbi:hypothetical protein A8L45_11230 [Veronia pacifica]|uniref:DUF3857 domain-containing protein n=2 Tax=Veronia pacifica TaxID=1080227 RepID=A0A1C3EIW6_9GAMM|nr:hypothetical protein A8L45_11230 [Veronia pacifica]
MFFVRLLAALLVLTSFQSASETPIFSPLPEWVAVTHSLPDKPIPDKGDQQYLLVDKQLNLTGPSPTSYKRVVVKALSLKGAATSSKISIEHVPDYQHVEIHSLSVFRDGVERVLPDSASIVVATVVHDRRSHLYSNKKRIDIALKDIRPGDIIDYSYTITGNNPVYGNYFDRHISVGWNAKVAESRSRILMPDTSNILVSNPQQKAKGKLNILTSEGLIEYSYVELDGHYDYHESEQPAWYDPYPYLHVTNFQTWQDIVDWALPLYTFNDDRSSAAIAADIKGRKAEDPEAQLVEAIHYAQNKVSHLGQQHKLDSHSPSAPDEVIHQGFGDNKEKALLMVALLRQLGAKATPALVSEHWKGTVRLRPVSPSSFDHVIVKLEHQGKTWWIDPTYTHQGSKLDTMAMSDHVLALVLEPGINNLETVPILRPDIPHQVIQNFIVNRADRDSYLSVTTQLKGREAERWRKYLSSTSEITLSDHYEKYYARHFKELAVLSPLTIADDTNANLIEIKESYIIKDLWQVKDNLYHFMVAGDIVDDFLITPRSSSRKTPFRYGHDGKVLQKIQLSLPDDWEVKPIEHTLNNPFFEYHSILQSMDDVKNKVPGKIFIEADYSYRSKARHVAPGQLNNYIKQVKLAWESSEYEFVYPVN